GRDGCRDLAEMVDKLTGLPLEFSPGSAWNYSVAMDVTGYLVQEISGQRFDVYVREQILEPLGMADTGYWVRPEQLDRFAANYSPAPAGGPLVLVDDPEASTF